MTAKMVRMRERKGEKAEEEFVGVGVGVTGGGGKDSGHTYFLLMY